VWTSRSSTRIALSSSWNSCISSSSERPWSSATHGLLRSHQLGEHVTVRAELLQASVLALGGVRRRHREVRTRAHLGRRGRDPLQKLLDPRPGGNRLTALEVEQLAAEPPPDRAPEVLLEQAVRKVGKRLAVVERQCDSDGEPV